MAVMPSRHAARSCRQRYGGDGGYAAQPRLRCRGAERSRSTGDAGPHRSVWAPDGSGRKSEAIGLLFYAGHGFQLEGSNYLLPVDAEIADISMMWSRRPINLDLTLAEIAFATNDHKLVILDVPAEQAISEACWRQPRSRRDRCAGRHAWSHSARCLGSVTSCHPHQGLYPLGACQCHGQARSDGRAGFSGGSPECRRGHRWRANSLGIIVADKPYLSCRTCRKKSTD